MGTMCRKSALETGGRGKPGQIAQQRQEERTFVPEMGAERREKLYTGWRRAVEATPARRVGFSSPLSLPPLT